MTKPVVTIITDFGNADGFVGIMKGVMLGIAPGLQVVDISNEIPPGDIAGGAWVLGNSFSYFPSGTIHLAVVDPGVGSKRRGLVVKTPAHTFVAPDNGLLSYVLEELSPVECFSIDCSEFWLKDVSATFHGRDIFAPVAAHLAAGINAADIGSAIGFDELVRLPLPSLDVCAEAVRGEVAYIDRFGNLITNIPMFALESARTCVISGHTVSVGETYSSVEVQQPMALAGSHGYVEIGVNQGRADAVFAAKVGTEVLLNLDR